MRDFKGGMKRQRGRNRKPGGGGGGGGSTNPNRAWESTGPENVKVRGNAQHVYERYQQLARDASSSGDRVLAENYLQHAEHYFRVLRTLQPQRPVSEIAARDAFASGFDLDFEDESGEPVELDGVAEAGETEGGDQQAAREERPERRDERREDRRDERREDRREREPRGEREERRDERGERRFEGEGRRESRRDRYERRRDERRPRGEGEARDPLAVIEPQGAPAPAAEAAPPAPAREDADHLPAFLRQPTPTPAAPAADEAPAAEERPRRTRRKRPASFDQGEGEAPRETAAADEEA